MLRPEEEDSLEVNLARKELLEMFWLRKGAKVTLAADNGWRYQQTEIRELEIQKRKTPGRCWGSWKG